MKIQINGNINEYYVQTLCMLFFPGVKFSKNESGEDAFSVDVSVADFGEGATATVTLKTDKGTATCTHSEAKSVSSKVSAEQIACGKAVTILVGLEKAFSGNDKMQKPIVPNRRTVIVSRETSLVSANQRIDGLYLVVLNVF